MSFLALPHLRCMTAANDSVLHELDVEGDGRLVTDENTASLERSVPGEAEVFAVDLCSRREPQAGTAPGSPGGWGRSLDGEYRIASDAPNGQVARDRQFSAPARVCAIGFVESQHSRNCCELPVHIEDHHVLDLEFGQGMGRIKVPGGRGGLQYS